MDSVTRIGNWAFGECFKLSSVDLPDTIAEIGHNAFCDCPVKDVPWKENGLTYWNKAVIGADSDIEAIEIRKGTSAISESAFEENETLQSVFIPDSVTSIGDNAFKGCINLTSINLPESLTHIGDGAFSGCSKIQNIKLPAGLDNTEEKIFG